jgi:hypothetical protein
VGVVCDTAAVGSVRIPEYGSIKLFANLPACISITEIFALQNFMLKLAFHGYQIRHART